MVQVRARQVAVLIVVILSLILVIPSQAKWLRMGDGNLLFQLEKVCKDGFTLTATYRRTLPDDFTPAPIEPPYYNVGDTRETGFVEIRFTDARAVISDQGTTAYLGFLEPDSSKWHDIWNSYSFAAPSTNIVMRVRSLDDRVGPDEVPLYGTVNVRWTGTFKPESKDIAIVWDTQFLQLAGWVELPEGVENCYLFGDGARPFDPGDARLNRDPGASATIYCEDDMVKVYGINADSVGYFAFAVSQAEIDQVGTSAQNTLLASAPSVFGGDIRLYRLASGEFQLNAPGLPPETGKEYVYTWEGC